MTSKRDTSSPVQPVDGVVLERVRQPCRVLVIGQTISLLCTSTGVFTTYLNINGFNLPLTQLLPLYYTLCLLFGPYHLYMLYKGQRSQAVPPWKYALIACADLEANFVAVKAYQYTTITSVMLLGCFAIPCTMVISYFLRSTRYNRYHFAGVAIAVCGLGLLLFADTVSGSGNGDHSTSEMLLGDVLALASAVLYAISNVSQEHIVKQDGQWEFLALLGTFGAVLCSCQMGIVEGSQLSSTPWDGYIPLYIFLFSLVLVLQYTSTPFLMQLSSATAYNLSLLTNNVWALVAGVVLFGQKPSLFYLLSFTVILIGLGMYSYRPPSPYESLEGDVEPGTRGRIVNSVASSTGRGVEIDEAQPLRI